MHKIRGYYAVKSEEIQNDFSPLSYLKTINKKGTKVQKQSNEN